MTTAPVPFARNCSAKAEAACPQPIPPPDTDRKPADDPCSPPPNGGFPQRPLHGMVAGDEKGLVASFTNMTKALKSLTPLLDTCIGVLGGCPGMD